MMPRLAYAGAIILDTEDHYSFLSAVSRIYATPAVIGVTRATEILQTGMTVKVDANKGLVTILALPQEKKEEESESEEMMPFVPVRIHENQ
jgi:phosphohistidine swiveling domain-containing protein